MKDLLYFAYGSNIRQARLEYRVGPVEFVEIYRLQGYKITFDCGGFANIQPSPGDYVEGVLYKITSSQIAELNHFEGFYRAEFFDYPRLENTLVVVYIGLEKKVLESQRFDIKCYPDYIDTILSGMIQKEMYESYRKLSAIKEDICIKPRPAKRKLKNNKRKR